MPSHLLGPLILLWPITEVYRGIVALQALRLSPYLLSDTVSNSLSLQTGGSGNIATINQQRQTGNTSASFPAQPLSMSGGMTGGGGWSTMGGRLGPLPDSVLRLAGTSHLLRAASWELYGRWVVVWSDFFLYQDYWLRSWVMNWQIWTKVNHFACLYCHSIPPGNLTLSLDFRKHGCHFAIYCSCFQVGVLKGLITGCDSAPMVRVSALVHAICYADVARYDDRQVCNSSHVILS